MSLKVIARDYLVYIMWSRNYDDKLLTWEDFVSGWFGQKMVLFINSIILCRVIKEIEAE